MSIDEQVETTSRGSDGGPPEGPQRRSPLALLVVLLGAAGSVVLLLWMGRRNRSALLAVLFTLWVLAPYVILAWAQWVSPRWSALTRATLQALTLAVTLVSLALYGISVFGPPRPQPAFFFVLVPPVSSLVLVLTLATAARVSRRRSHPTGPL